MKRFVTCKIIGDGLTIETAFRPAIVDIVDPETGLRAFNITEVHKVENGQPVYDWALCHAAGKNFKLVDNNPDIDLWPDHPATVQLSAMTMPEKAQMGQRLTARGINMAQFDNTNGMKEIIEHCGKLHDPDFSVDNFDVADVD